MEEVEEYVDGYEMHALGWLFLINFFALQGEDGLAIAEARADLFEKEIEARSHLDSLQNMFAQRRVRFTGEVVASVKKLVQMMQRCPGCFGYTVLSHRKRYFGFAILFNFGAAFIVAEFLSPVFGTIAFVFFMLGLLCCFPLTILFRVTGMMKRLKIDSK